MPQTNEVSGWKRCGTWKPKESSQHHGLLFLEKPIHPFQREYTVPRCALAIHFRFFQFFSGGSWRIHDKNSSNRRGHGYHGPPKKGWVWLKINRRGYAGFGPCFHFLRFHFRYRFFEPQPGCLCLPGSSAWRRWQRAPSPGSASTGAGCCPCAPKEIYQAAGP